MNHIAETWATKLSNRTNSSTCNKTLPPEDTGSPTVVDCSSWKTKMLSKVKECRDAIKNMMTFDRILNDSRTAQPGARNSSNSSTVMGARTSMSSIPDIITFSSIALKHNDYGEERIPIKNSTLNSDERTTQSASL